MWADLTAVTFGCSDLTEQNRHPSNSPANQKTDTTRAGEANV
jgi:hypothetical protein